MDIAKRFAQLSHAKRLKVGACIVKDDVIVPGYNGTPAGWDNGCESKVYDLSRDFNGNYFPGHEVEYPLSDENGRYKLVTKPEVLHAEMNSLSKVAKSTLSANGATMYVTHSPCMECAKAIYQSGITHVCYETDYRSNDGIKFLKDSGVNVIKMGD